MAKRRTFSADFKLETVLDMVRGEKPVGQICRERDITESLLYKWRDAFFERAPAIFADGRSNGNDPQAERIAELERMVGKLTMEWTLSGGEQQMLTIARTLMGNPDLLLLDEPSEGLAPLIVEHMGDLIRQIKGEGVTLLLAEQNTFFALGLSDRIYIIDDGRTQYSGTAEEVKAHPEIVEKYLTVHQ